MLSARISAISSYVPDDILDNEMLSKMVETNDEWITTRVGIKERRILRKEGAGSSYMGIKALEKLMAEYSIDPASIDLLICATSNPDYRFPSTGSVIAHGAGLSNCYAYDIQAACAGFIVALTGDIMTMPGLPKVPAAERIDIDENGVISGLF